MSAGVFGGAGIAHPGKPVYAAYVDGECVAVDRAPVVAGKAAVATAVTMPWIPAAIASSTNDKRAKEKADIIKTRTKGK